MFTGKLKGKRHVGSHRRKMEDNIRKDHNEIDANKKVWTYSAQDTDYTVEAL